LQDPDDSILGRLEDQIAWYDRKSLTNHHSFKRIKTVEIVAAGMIPFFAALKFSQIGCVTCGLGVLIMMLEGMLHLKQYQQNWIAYRWACESLKHEKYAYLGRASSYANVADPPIRALC